MARASEPVVCVVGGGTAGLEGLLALRRELPEATLRLIAPQEEFRYRPMSPDSPFQPATERGLAISSLARDVGAELIADRADLVDRAARTILTRDGTTVAFEHLLIAVGSRPERALRQGWIWERGADPGFLDAILHEIEGDRLGSVGVVVPRGARWPLPAYELALVLGWRAAAAGSRTRVALVTIERQPLGALGGAAGELVSEQLRDAGVEVIAGVEAHERRSDVADGNGRHPAAARLTLLDDDGRATLDPVRAGDGRPDPDRLERAKTLEVDRLISLPTVSGPFLSGVPTDAAGFIEVDETLGVCASPGVWAAGGCIDAALEHSALSAGQADAAAVAIAVAAGASPSEPPRPPELAGLLLQGQRERWLAENPAGTREPSTRCLWWPPGRAVGRMLAERIAALDTDLAEALPSLPPGLPVRVPVALGREEPTRGGVDEEPARAPDADDRTARLRDIEQRQLMALIRQERSADAELRALDARLQSLQSSQDRAIRELHRHGYLRGRT